MTDNVIKIFVDFDGTITKEDVGDAVFSRFGNKQKVDGIIKDLLDGKITAKQCWLNLCETVEKISVTELDSFINTIEIDPGFHEFAGYCKRNNIEFYVLSDGFDYYIEKILRREGLDWIKYYSNRLEISGNGKMIPHFPYEDYGCTTSANCKRNHIITLSSDNDFTVYIGDGNSDKYTSQFCDYIFAKDELLRYCEMERISFFPYNNFFNVTERLDQLRTKKRLKKRHQAELKRREIYMME